MNPDVEKKECEHDYSIPVSVEKNLFHEVVTEICCRKCGKTISTGRRLFNDW